MAIPSAAEQLAQNFSLGAFSKARELKTRLWFTLAALIVYRLGTYIPVPGVDAGMLAQIFAQHGGGMLGVFDTFAGGALSRMSVFALNIMPYISASIIIQLMTAISPQLEALKKEGESGRKQLNQYTRYLTVVLAAVQAYGLAVGLEGMRGSGSDILFRVSVVVTLVGGTVFLMWLGEQITERGIGNGTSLIIFAGIVAHLPIALGQLFELSRTGSLPVWGALLICLVAVTVIVAVVYMERAQRKVIIQHPKRQMGNRTYAADSSHLPLKLNTAGVIPPIFASSLLLLPATLLGFSQAGAEGSRPEWLLTLSAWLQHGQPLYMFLYAALIFFFAFFYTAIVFNPSETAENLRKSGGFVPGFRPGKATAQHLDAILTRLTAVGAVYLAAVCLLPEFLIAEYGIPFYLGGTSLLIVVSVTMDTVGHVHAHIMAQQYEGLIRKAKLKGTLR
jgi:preprotein translocase subunit SecY